MISGICDICKSAGQLFTCSLCGARVCKNCMVDGICKQCYRGRWMDNAGDLKSKILG